MSTIALLPQVEAKMLRVCDVPSTALFDLGNIQLQQIVQPCDEFLSVCC
jgi:hypothetical protein